MNDKRLKRFFAIRPKVDTAYMTKDGLIYLKRKHADRQGESVKVNRSEIINDNK